LVEKHSSKAIYSFFYLIFRFEIPVHDQIEKWIDKHEGTKQYHSNRRQSQDAKSKRYQSKSKKFSPKKKKNFSYKDNESKETQVIKFICLIY
jgi:hypothetical protein